MQDTTNLAFGGEFYDSDKDLTSECMWWEEDHCAWSGKRGRVLKFYQWVMVFCVHALQ